MINSKTMKESKIFLMILSLGVFFTSCRDEVPGLGEMPDASEIEFTVTQNYDIDAGGNTVIFELVSDGYLPIWDYGSGSSTSVTDTVHYPFAGEYTISLSVETRAGILEVDSVVVTVTENNLDYISDPLWTYISGGIGMEKTWYLDLDANGTSKYFDGPLYFYGTDNGWLEEGDAFSGGDAGCYGDDCWVWAAPYSDNSWLMDAGDYGSMTFNLIGNPYVHVDNLMLASQGEQSGTYYLDTDEYTMSLTNAGVLHDANYDGCVTGWGSITLFALDENIMQLGVIRNVSSCGDPCFLVYNFISKDYSDAWDEENGYSE